MAFHEGAIFEEDWEVQAWYFSPDRRSHGIAKEAYEAAIEHLKQEFAGNSDALAWIQGHKSLNEIHAEASGFEEQYHAAGAGKKGMLHCVRRISSFIMFYGKVMDTLTQHHAEYVSLAWGALKFVLQGVINHERLTTHMSQALLDVANVLPRTELHSKLYPTERMKDSLAQLYAHLLLFLREAVKWFSRGSVGRALSAVIKPFELKHKEVIDQIHECAKAVDEEASAASKAEVRGLHVRVQEHGKFIADLDRKLDDKYRAHDEKLGALDTKLEDIRTEIKEIKCRVTEVQGTTRNTQMRVIDLQYNEVINNLKPKTLPEDALRKQRALSKRDPSWVRDNQSMVTFIQRMGNWVSAPACPLMILQAGPRGQAAAKELALDLIGVLEPTTTASIWHLVDTGPKKEALTTGTDVLRSLVFQLMRLSPGLMNSGAAELDAARFQGQHSEAQWLELLCNIVQRLPQCFVLVEAEDAPDQAKEAEGLLAMLDTLIGQCQGSSCRLKVLFLSGSHAAKGREASTIITVLRPVPPPPHLRRVKVKRNARATAWSGVTKHLQNRQ